MSVLRDSDIGVSTLAELKAALDRLTRERDEALAQQAATAEVLKVISRSAVDLPAVLDTLLASASILAEADIGTIRYQDGAAYRLAATYGCAPEWREHFARYSMKPDRGSVFGQTILKGGTVHIPDVLADPDYARPDAQKLMNLRAALGVPLIRDGRVFGVINLFRSTPRSFTAKQIALVETFAHQAVIAIENVRLFEAEQQRSAELSEALEQQKATSDVLGVISSSAGELKPVFETILANAVRICDAKFGSLYRYDNGTFDPVALFDAPAALAEFVWKRGSFVPPPRSNLDRLLQTKDVVRIADESAGLAPGASARFAGARSLIAVPMLKNNVLIGAISIYRREVQPFTDKQVELVQHFAAQAVIAIENARLLSELRESLSQQTATADVLKVISRSTFDLQAVLDTLVESAARLCEAYDSLIFLRHDDRLRIQAHHGPIGADFSNYVIGRGWVTGRAFVDQSPIHVHDLTTSADFPDGRDMAIRNGHRTIFAVPLLRQNESIGVLTIRRSEVKPFTEKQIELVRTFADQAVIAIENVRLFEAEQQRTNELRESLDRHTATADILKVIAASPTDVQPVFDAIAHSATRLLSSQATVVTRVVGEEIHLAALTAGSEDGIKEVRGSFPTPLSSSGIHSRVARSGTPAFRTDIENDPEVSAEVRRLARARGYRSILVVPMLRDGVAIGTIGVTRREPGAFTDTQIDLLRTFADQAVIAIENVRLFDDVQKRTEELTESLEQQTATSEVLKVISSSPGELAPVFDSMLANATRICEASLGVLLLSEGDAFRTAAIHGSLPAAFMDKWRSGARVRRDPDLPAQRAAVTRQPVQIADLRTTPAYRAGHPLTVSGADDAGIRTMVALPMIKDNEAVGVIAIYRQEIRPFTDKQIELVTNFAAQAVIAIENTRLLSELRDSLERQTATSEVLKVISSSPGELEPVFQAMLENATHLCEAHFGAIVRFDGELFHPIAELNTPPRLSEFLRERGSFTPQPGSVLEQVIQTKAVVQIEDDAARPTPGAPAKFGGARSTLGVPMVKDDKLVGAFVIYRTEVRPFTDKQMELVSNFAAQAVIAIENTRLLSELRESLAQQTATSEVLSVISSSPGELAPVFEAMLENATRICEAKLGTLFLLEGEAYRAVAVNGDSEYAEWYRREPVVDMRQSVQIGTPLRRLLHGKSVIHIHDLRNDEAYLGGNPRMKALVESAGARTHLVVPMLKDAELIGAIVIYRQEVRPFGDKQIELVQNFAAQAVIAIENTRLLNELRESLEQQTGTAEVLRVISSSPGELQPVFDTMLAKATELCDASYGAMWLREGDGFRNAAFHGELPPEYIEQWRGGALIRPGPDVPMMRAAQTRQPVQMADLRDSSIYRDREPIAVKAVDAAGIRTLIAVPMFKAGEVIGTITIYRKEVRPFTDKQVALVTNFASQAVIAIENARLLSELRESLSQQTATADVLKVISRSTFDLQTVLDTLSESVARLCEAYDAALFLRQGDRLHVKAHYGPIHVDFADWAIDQGWVTGRAFLDRAPVQVDDLSTSEEFPDGRDMALRLGHRTMLAVPLLRENESIGAIALRRFEVKPFTEKQIELVKTFADQAVIAIENARLFEEVQARTAELSESLEQQTATSEVLRVISSSPGALEPVFQAILENATRICDAKFGNLLLAEGDAFRYVALYGAPAEYLAERKREPMLQPKAGAILDRLQKTKQAVHVADVLTEGGNDSAAIVTLAGARTLLNVPMLKDGSLIGTIGIYRQEVRPFTDKQIELVQNFAAQAVIAIENARLLSELRESLEQQTATSDVLKVISSSPGSLEPVFNAMLENAVRICHAQFGVMHRFAGDEFEAVAMLNIPSALEEFLRQRGLGKAIPGSDMDRLTNSKQFIHTLDMLAEPVPAPPAKFGGARTQLAVPMLKDEHLVGAFAIYRQEVLPFTEKQIELVQNFAAQAVIAIENTRLLSELRESLEQQTATSEVLRVISSSPGDLDPVFDSILKNATDICEAKFATLFRYNGETFCPAAHIGAPAELVEAHNKRGAFKAVPGTVLHSVWQSRTAVQSEDDTKASKPGQHVIFGGARSTVGVPMIKDETLVGIIVIYRQEVRPFTEKQIALVANFAAQAVIAIENARLLSELRETLERQTATSEVLKVIASSSGELQPVFDAMLANAARLCGASYGNLWLRDGDGFRSAALHGPLPTEYVEMARNIRGGSNTAMMRVKQTRRPVQVPDTRETRAYLERDPLALATVDIAGVRALLSVPMLKDDELVGVITIYRREVGPFSDKHVELVANFASQAVIAIENTRLLNELRQRTDDLSESLEQQTATSEVLKVISSSAGELQPVFVAMLENATRLCGAKFGNLYLREGDAFRTTAMYNVPPAFAEARRREPLVRPTPFGALGRVMTTKLVEHIPDVAAEEGYINRDPMFVSAVELGGFRSLIGVPMLKDGELIGIIVIYRQEVGEFSAKQIALVENFAAQAVIAIENTRLLNELRQRTDDLSESLEQQTASNEILRVISGSQTDVQPVFDTIVANAVRLCGARMGAVHRFDGKLVHVVAHHNYTPEAVEILHRMYPRPPLPDQASGRAILAREVVQIEDMLSDLQYTRELTVAGGWRSILAVPMLRDGAPIGAILITRNEVGRFAERHIELLKTFADQAVIAIENARLFDEVQARTEDLQESLQQQTATGNVLEVISRSAFDLQPVFETVAESAVKLCGADRAFIFRFDGELLRSVVAYNAPLPLEEFIRDNPIRPDRSSAAGRAAFERRTVHIPNVTADPEYTFKSKDVAPLRTILTVPILKGDELLGVILTYRLEVKPFTDKQIALVETFADQAAIAIENVRLFDEVQARTEDLQESLQQQTATADVLKVISRSTFDLVTVLDTLLKSAARLCEADHGTITQRKGDKFYRTVSHGYPAEFLDYVKDIPVEPSRHTGTGRALLEGKVIHIPDVEADSEYTWAEAKRLANFRSMLGVPMLREGEAVGVLTLTRTDVRPFTEKQIELVATFADQAAIAIENVRLFDEIQEKSRQLEEASKHKSQFLANMSHELRTPLNAILGYTELIADGVYGETPEKVQTTIQRIITNGKHLLGLINDVLDLSKIEAGQLTLSLADYSMKDVVHAVYGAVEPLAAGKKLAFKAEIAPDLPTGHGDERRLTQVLLNLVGNAIKFTDQGSVTIKAALKDGMFSVAVVDTGPGISEADKPKLFQEFQQADSSTTKKKGGTGLGLAISKRIIEMHGGTVALQSRVGEGSTFSFTVPVHAEQAKRAT